MAGDALKQMSDRLAGMPVKALLADEARNGALVFEAAGLRLDARRQRLDLAAWQDLLSCASDHDPLEKLKALYDGDIVNATEERPALHPACRNPDVLKDETLAQALAETQQKTRDFAEQCQSLALLDGHRVERVVSIGIGGSDLGPRFVYDALKAERQPGLDVRFVSNLDPADLEDALEGADPRTTLVVVISKSFTTQETLLNANAARAWIVDQLGERAVSARFAAATACPEKAIEFGLTADRVFPFPQGLGGRYSLWSAVGLSLQIGLKSGVFERLLEGAQAMDEHAISTPLETNMVVAKAVLDAFNRIGHGLPSRCVTAYSSRLERLAAYLQQLEMESLGKSVSSEGSPLPKGYCGPLVWGGRGSDLQHSVFQWLHQGQDEAPVDFIAIADHGCEDPRVQALNANLVAQGAALSHGRTADGALGAHKSIQGQRASSTLVMEHLSPEALGALLSLHEHKVFIEGLFYGLNPFDQWGVELGKTLARSILSGDMSDFDAPARDLAHRLGLDPE